MANKNGKMNVSYKVVLVFSIFMFITGFWGAIIYGGYGNVVTALWGWTVWKMFKRDNNSLVKLYKVWFWIQVPICAFMLFLSLSIPETDLVKYVGFSTFELLFFTFASVATSYGLLKYFRKQCERETLGENILT